MALSEQCYNCLVERQISKATNEEFKRRAQEILDNREPDDVSPYMVYCFDRLREEMFGKTFSFAAEKKQFNDFVLNIQEDIRAEIHKAEDPVLEAFRFARIGNYIDFGALRNVDENQFIQMLEEAELNEHDLETYESFVAQLGEGGEANPANPANPGDVSQPSEKTEHGLEQSGGSSQSDGSSEQTDLARSGGSSEQTDLSRSGGAKTFLLITDNCGEIVLDKLFIETLKEHFPQLKVKVLVRGGEALNDANREDAEYVGMNEIAEIIDNGAPVAGTIWKLMPESTREAMRTADVILAKGQGNYESLTGSGMHIFFAFLCKCDFFMEQFGVERFTGMFIEE